MQFDVNSTFGATAGAACDSTPSPMSRPGKKIIDVGVAARQSATDARPLQDGCYGPTSRHFGTHGLALSARPSAKTVTDLAHILHESLGDQRETTGPTTPFCRYQSGCELTCRGSVRSMRLLTPPSASIVPERNGWIELGRALSGYQRRDKRNYYENHGDTGQRCRVMRAGSGKHRSDEPSHADSCSYSERHTDDQCGQSAPHEHPRDA